MPGARYRSLAARRQICRDILRGKDDTVVLQEHQLDEVELANFKSLAADIELAALRAGGPFKAYYNLPLNKPLVPIFLCAATLSAVCIAASMYIDLAVDLKNKDTYTLVSASCTLLAIVAAVIGWGFSGWITHRNARLQHTINLITTRFTQQTFVTHFNAFHRKFGYSKDEKVTRQQVEDSARSDKLDDNEAAQSVRFILNYYELISFALRSGDLDKWVIDNTAKSHIMFYYDKCLPFIREIKEESPKAWEHLGNLRDSYRDL